MQCNPAVVRTVKEIKTVNGWDLLTGIPAGMSAFVAAALAGAIIGNVETASATFLWLLALGSALIAILVGITRARHAAPSAFIQGLFTVGSSLWLWISIYPDPAAILSILVELIILLILPIVIAVKARDLRMSR